MEEGREDVHKTWRRIKAEMKTTGKMWKELEKAAMERKQWKSLVTALCACLLGAMRIIYINLYITNINNTISFTANFSAVYRPKFLKHDSPVMTRPRCCQAEPWTMNHG